MQHRKLFDRDDRLPLLHDKVGVKAIVADALGPDWVIPTLWHGEVLPADPPWPLPVIVKARHGCHQNMVVRRSHDWEVARRRAAAWTRRRYGYWLDEWAYAGVPRGVLVEPLIGSGPALPIDYKVFVFGGHAAYVEVHLGRGGDHRWIVMDRRWRRVSAPSQDLDPAPPRSLAAMLDGAERLARGFTFLRVDLYDIDGRPLFGELTVYPGSGLLRVDPLSLDRRMGAQWRAARSNQA